MDTFFKQDKEIVEKLAVMPDQKLPPLQTMYSTCYIHDLEGKKYLVHRYTRIDGIGYCEISEEFYKSWLKEFDTDED